MAYDSTMLAAIDTAIAELVAGSRVVTIVKDGMSMQYGQTQLGELQALRAKVVDSIAGAVGSSSYVLTRTKKGL